MKLYYTPNFNPRVAVAVAKYLNAPVEFVRAHPRHPAHQEAFRPINPNTLAPVLVDDNGSLWETDAITCRLSALVGSDFWRLGEEMPKMIMWVSWAAQHLNRAAGTIYFERMIRPMFSDQPADPASIAEALANFNRHAAILDAALADRQWLLGDRISYADFRVATSFPFAEGSGLPLAPYPNITRLNNQLLALEAWRDPFKGLKVD